MRVAVHFTGRPMIFEASSTSADLVVDARLHAEAAADVAGDHAHAALGHAQRLGQLLAEVERALQRRVDRVAVGGLVVDADAPRGSIVAAMTRLMTKRCLMTCGALAMAASVAALSPSVWTKQMLSGFASWTAGAPGFSASSAVKTAGTTS